MKYLYFTVNLFKTRVLQCSQCCHNSIFLSECIRCIHGSSSHKLDLYREHANMLYVIMLIIY